jgi:aminoglycoside phosphotransferase (APT) family kinase protein
VSTTPNFLHGIPDRNNWKTIQKIEKGWSKEQKFRATDLHGKSLLIRITDSEKEDSKRKEFAAMQKIANMGIPISTPLNLGLCGDGKFFFSLFSWVEGTALDEKIHLISMEEQYTLGKQAGLILKQMHSLPAPFQLEDWEIRQTKKISKHLENYKACGFKVSDDNKALKFIENNMHLLKNRPQHFQHGDFHVGNLVLSPAHKIHVIDFNRWDYGDPWEEFYKMCLFSREKSIPFAIGQIHAYFDHKIPSQFFELLAFYLADVILYSVVWAIPFGEKEVQGMIERAHMIMEDYNGFEITVPRWFEN